MSKNAHKELQEEARAMREGRSRIEPYTGNEAAETESNRRGTVQVSVSKRTYSRLSRLAKKKQIPISDLLDRLVKRGDKFVD